MIRSVQSGPWSQATTWENGQIPGHHARVQVVAGHSVVYDLESDVVIRSIHVSGTLRFAINQNTRLNVGLVKIQAGEDASESGFDCEAHSPDVDEIDRPALLVGTQDEPIPAGHTAHIRLCPVPGLDTDTCPAIVCCGGRMEFQGAPLARTWVKLGLPAQPGEKQITLAEPVPGWNVGDTVVITATSRKWKDGESLRPGPGPGPGTETETGTGTGTAPRLTEVRKIRTIDGPVLTLDEPLTVRHEALEMARGEVANLTRNVVVESAEPETVRGHTMYHRGSSGSIGYAEFRHLGKEGRKGRYPIHFHLVGETMRGSSVVGASIWDSGNRWVTIHGTNRLIVRDCVGYQSVGHGIFLEDGTETLNVLDRNLAIQAFSGKPLPDQALAFDNNAGAGFWWANSLNTFTRNVAAECDRYGFRFEATPTAEDNLQRTIRFPDGQNQPANIRTVGFVRFAANEAHAQLYGINLGEGSEPEKAASEAPPFVFRSLKLWDCFWALRPEVPELLVDGLTIERSRFGIYQPATPHLAYRKVSITRTFAAGSVPSFTPGDEQKLTQDTQPPATVVTFVSKPGNGFCTVRGSSTDDGEVQKVLVNGFAATAKAPGFLEWEVQIPVPLNRMITASSVDATGKEEPTPHRLEMGH